MSVNYYMDQERMDFYLITDDRRFIECREYFLEANGIELVHSGFNFDQRWSSTGITQFVRREVATADRSQLFQEVRSRLRTYIELHDERLYDFLSLWDIGTYFFPLFNTFPYVYVGGISQSGKTKLLTLCSCLSFNSIPSANMTTATVYRLVQNARCSLFIDETEHLSNRYRAEDFRNILLNGYKKGLKTYRSRRTEDGGFEVESFEMYGPKMLANIEGLDDVLESRCVTIIMQRGSNREITNREVDVNDIQWQQVRDMIYPFMMVNWKEVRDTYSQIQNDTTLSCRSWELWKPILVLAEFFDNTVLFRDMKALAVEKTEEAQRDDSETEDYVLVETLLSMVTEDGYHSLRGIRNEMVCRLRNGSWLTERSVGRLLRRLGFSERRRVGTGYEYLFRVSQVRSLAHTLGIAASEHSELGEHTAGQGFITANQSTEGDTS